MPSLRTSAATSGKGRPLLGKRYPEGEWPYEPSGVLEDGTPFTANYDRGVNPVFVHGAQCWRRYRFGGWVTMADPWFCETLAEFYRVAYNIDS